MPDGVLDTTQDQVRRHPLRLAILALNAQGKSLVPADLRRELPGDRSIRLIEHHLLVLREVELLPPQEKESDRDQVDGGLDWWK